MTSVFTGNSIDFRRIDERTFKKVLTAETSAQATRATNLKEFFDNIIDQWFRGGKKREAIVNLFEAVTFIRQTSGRDEPGAESARLENFLRLQEQALPDYQGRFFIEVIKDKSSSGNKTCGYALLMGDKEVYRYREAHGVAQEVSDHIENSEKRLRKRITDMARQRMDAAVSGIKCDGMSNMNKIHRRLEASSCKEFFRLRELVHPGYLSEFKIKPLIPQDSSQSVQPGVANKFKYDAHSGRIGVHLQIGESGCMRNIQFSEDLFPVIFSEFIADVSRDYVAGTEAADVARRTENAHSEPDSRDAGDGFGTINNFTKNCYDELINNLQKKKGKSFERLRREIDSLLKQKKIGNTTLLKVCRDPVAAGPGVSVTDQMARREVEIWSDLRKPVVVAVPQAN